MAHESFHEAAEKLKPETMDMHRAILSLMEEMEAVDWYNQRADACEDDELRKILIHNANEEKEHAVMMIEWIRRKDSFFDAQLKKRLYRDGPIVGEKHK